MEKNKPFFPAEYSLADIAAIQAMATGTASSDQQKRALKWIVEEACATYGLNFYPGESFNNDFAAGKRYVGQQIIKLTKINSNALKEGKTHERRR